MRSLYKTIVALTLAYVVGGCASTGALEQQRKDAELDALLAEPIPAVIMLKQEETPVVKVRARTPRPLGTVSAPDPDLLQYLISPEEKAAQAKAEAEEAKRITAEAEAKMVQKYQTCKEDLKYQLPPGATGKCEGTEGTKYMNCTFKIDGSTHGVRVPETEIAKGGAEAAYQHLVAKAPTLLEEIAKKHCTIKTRTLEFEEEEVLDQSSLDYMIDKI